MPDAPSSDENAAAFDPAHDDVFTRIASRYDLLCDLFSLGIHRTWKNRMARRIGALPWTQMLDVAAGTGDVALRVIRAADATTARHLIVSDLCPAMLRVAQRRAGACAIPTEFRILDAHDMGEIPDASIDLYSISLGLKICDRALVFAEAWRVLRPGGTFISLEASEIPVPFLQRAYLAYMRLAMPVVGFVATGGDSSAYDYLLRGVRGFPGAGDLAKEIEARGFVDVTYEHLSFGIVAIHMARKPDEILSSVRASAYLA